MRAWIFGVAFSLAADGPALADWGKSCNADADCPKTEECDSWHMCVPRPIAGESLAAPTTALTPTQREGRRQLLAGKVLVGVGAVLTLLGGVGLIAALTSHANSDQGFAATADILFTGSTFVAVGVPSLCIGAGLWSNGLWLLKRTPAIARVSLGSGGLSVSF